jgi:3-oxoacyl-[acyl-carrier protein] reductase
MLLRLNGETALVTGGGRGIGRGIALALAEAGAAVALVDRDADGVEASAAAIRQEGGRAIGLTADVSRPDDVQAMVDAALSEFGALDILVNNAAIDNARPVVEMPLELWQEMIDVNLTSVFLCCRAVLPSMIERRKGRIINLGSNLALKGGERLAHYCAAKAGVHGLTRALALEVAQYGIAVNVIAPGPVETDMLFSLPEDWLEAKRAELPLKRFGTVEEIVPTVVLLASSAGSFFIGSTINVSGGDVMM